MAAVKTARRGSAKEPMVAPRVRAAGEGVAPVDGAGSSLGAWAAAMGRAGQQVWRGGTVRRSVGALAVGVLGREADASHSGRNASI